MEEVYSIRQACNLLKIKVRTMREWIRRGKIMASKDQSGRWYITAEEVARKMYDDNKD